MRISDWSSDVCSSDLGPGWTQGGRCVVTGLMQGKRGLIMGLANDKSLAWGIAQKLSEHGAELAFSYQGEMMEKRVRPLAEQLGPAKLIACDVSDTAASASAFDELAPDSPPIHFVAPANGLSDKT